MNWLTIGGVTFYLILAAAALVVVVALLSWEYYKLRGWEE